MMYAVDKTRPRHMYMYGMHIHHDKTEYASCRLVGQPILGLKHCKRQSLCNTHVHVAIALKTSRVK